MAKVKRFLIREPNGEALLLDHAEAPGVVLSRAITQASRSTEPGVWEVVEYEDVLYRVHRLDPFEIRVEVMKQLEYPKTENLWVNGHMKRVMFKHKVRDVRPYLERMGAPDTRVAVPA